MSPFMAQYWPVVKRDSEYTTIHSALVDQKGICGIVLIGDAGVGKTTLARLVTQSLPSRVQWVAGTESARSIPLGVFAHLVGRATSRDPVAFLVSRARNDSRRRAFGHRRRRRASAGPVVGNAAASAGAGRLGAHRGHRAVRRGGSRRDHLAVEGRLSSAAAPDPVQQGPVRRADRRCARRPGGGPVRRPDVGGVGGNALFVRHLVEGALEAGTLRQVRGVWQLRGRTAVTSELASLLDSRVDQLPDDVLHTLRLLTFCEPLDLDTLTDIVGHEAVEEAETSGLIRVVEEARPSTCGSTIRCSAR